MQKFAKDIYVETKFPGVTVGAIAGPEGFVCVDTPTRPSEARAWRQQLEQATGKSPKQVINLDHHRDRALGNQWFEAPVTAHDLAYDRLRLLPDLYKNSPAEPGADSEMVEDLHGLRVILPQITFTQQLSLMAGPHEIRLVHRPGVTPGALWVELPEAGVVFVGDCVTHKVPPFLHEANLAVWLENLVELRKTKWVKTIVPGRGGTLAKENLKPLEDVLKLVQRKLEALARARKPRSELDSLSRDLLAKYTVPAELRTHYLRRLRSGLEHLYDRLLQPVR
jgi:glyoxylase-like metal-dependent hydrolase (beta-lactamase superfamily II)